MVRIQTELDKKQGNAPLRLEKHVVKLGQNNLDALPSTTNCCKVVFGWAGEAKKHLLSLFWKIPSWPCKFYQFLSHLVAILRRHNQIMENQAVQLTKDLNIKDQTDLKKKYNCNQCNYSTTEAGNLKRHKLVHSGEKPFACSQCKYSCSETGSL